MEEDPNRPELSLSVDLLAPEGYGEIIGGGQRTDRLELLAACRRGSPDFLSVDQA